MTTRTSVLLDASELVRGERESAYGPPSESFGRIAALWSAYFGWPIESHDVAACLALLKLSRIAASPSKRDSWVDLAGYAACGAEVATQNDVSELQADADVHLYNNTFRYVTEEQKADMAQYPEDYATAQLREQTTLLDEPDGERYWMPRHQPD